MVKTFALIGAPSSAGAHWPGQEKAPRYLREAGLVKRLESAGFDIIDFGDLPVVRFQPDRDNRHQQNLISVVEVCEGVADKVDLALREDAIPIVIGGDCTIGLGVVSGFLRHSEDLSLLYFDGHVDLNTPATSTSGILDSMGLAHLIGLPGTARKLTHIGKRFPLIPEDKVVLFGYNPEEINTPEQEALLRQQLKCYPLSDVQGRSRQAALDAVKNIEDQSERFIVHFDVDVIDFTDLPIADVPQFSQGLMFREAIGCLAVFASSTKFNGLTITEFNPDHTDAAGTLAESFIKGLVNAFLGQETDMT